MLIGSGYFLAVSAYEDQLAVLSVSLSAGDDIIDKVHCYYWFNHSTAHYLRFYLGFCRNFVSVIAI